MNCHFCGLDCRNACWAPWRGDEASACSPPCDAWQVAAELLKEERAGVPCARTWIIVNRTNLPAERVKVALELLKARGIAVEDEVTGDVFGWRLK